MSNMSDYYNPESLQILTELLHLHRHRGVGPTADSLTVRQSLLSCEVRLSMWSLILCLHCCCYWRGGGVHWFEWVSCEIWSPIRSRLGHLTFTVSGLYCCLNSPRFFISPLLKCFKRSSRQNISFFLYQKRAFFASILFFLFNSAWETSCPDLKIARDIKSIKVKKWSPWFGLVRVLFYHYLIVPESPQVECFQTLCGIYCQSPDSYEKRWNSLAGRNPSPSTLH